MAKYTFKYFFEWGFFNEDICPCLWSDDDVTKDIFGYSVSLGKLPISDELKRFLFELGEKHDNALDWSGENKSLSWTEEEKQNFYKEAEEGYKRLQTELGDDYKIVYCENKE